MNKTQPGDFGLYFLHISLISLNITKEIDDIEDEITQPPSPLIISVLKTLVLRKYTWNLNEVTCKH